MRAGHRDDFAEIIRRYQPDVWRAAAVMLTTVEETEDVVQQVFVQVFFRLDQFRLGEDFGPWIRTIARNCVRDRMRTASRESNRLLAWRDRILAETDDDESLERDEQRFVALKHCLHSLTDEQRQVLDLHYQENLKFDEVAQRLQKNAEAVRRMASRLRIRLRECIERRLAEA